MGLVAAVVIMMGAAASAHVRLLVRNTNWYYTRHRCYIGSPSKEGAGGTGMGRGATELRVGEGDITFAHQDINGIWPPIAYHCPTRPPGGPEVALDLTFGWVYTADGLTWTVGGCSTFAQTFIADGPELVSVRCLVASPPKPIDVSLHKGGPDGPQIGGTKQFTAGTAGWGLVYWQPDEAPTIPGETYAIVLRNANGEGWNPYVHSRGNCYDGGHAYFDGVPYPQTDLSILISNPGDGYVRHRPIPNDARDPAEWSDVPSGQRFVARARNLIFASVEVESGPIPEEHQDKGPVYLVVRRGGPDGERVGGRMSLDHMPSGAKRAVKARGIPFGPDSVPLEPSEVYFAALELADGYRPTDWRVRMRLYGEEARGSHPTVASVWTGRIFPNSIEVTWRKGNPSKAVIEYGKPGGSILGTVEEVGDDGIAAIVGLEPDTSYQFRLIATSPQGYKYYSPWYLVRTRAEDGTLNPVDRVQRFGAFDPFFLPVAFSPLRELKLHEAADGKVMKLPNPGFESGMKGWTVTDGIDPEVSGGNDELRPHGGKKMAGWLRVHETEKLDMDKYVSDSITQTVSVTPGKWYQLSAWVMTAEPDWTADQWHEDTWNFPNHTIRGRDRARLVVDAKGGDDFEGTNSTQWFFTDGEWLLITKDFKAEEKTITVGAAFSQWGEREWDAAFVDDFRLVELTEAPY
jgi:hypothetical protein